MTERLIVLQRSAINQGQVQAIVFHPTPAFVMGADEEQVKVFALFQRTQTVPAAQVNLATSFDAILAVAGKVTGV